MQPDESRRKNASYFSKAQYAANVNEIDTYRAIRDHIDREIAGIASLLDVGNGGVFDYNTELAGKIVGVDLFSPSITLPPNVTMLQGDALALPFSKPQFDAVLMVMLLHHLVGTDVSTSRENTRRSLREASRVSLPEAKLIVVESCVPKWFYALEAAVFPISRRVISATMSHPAVLQYDSTFLAGAMRDAGYSDVIATRIPLGKFILQFGVQWPSALSPIDPVIFVGRLGSSGVRT